MNHNKWCDCIKCTKKKLGGSFHPTLCHCSNCFNPYQGLDAYFDHSLVCDCYSCMQISQTDQDRIILRRIKFKQGYRGLDEFFWD